MTGNLCHLTHRAAALTGGAGTQIAEGPDPPGRVDAVAVGVGAAGAVLGGALDGVLDGVLDAAGDRVASAGAVEVGEGVGAGVAVGVGVGIGVGVGVGVAARVGRGHGHRDLVGRAGGAVVAGDVVAGDVVAGDVAAGSGGVGVCGTSPPVRAGTGGGVRCRPLLAVDPMDGRGPPGGSDADRGDRIPDGCPPRAGPSWMPNAASCQDPTPLTVTLSTAVTAMSAERVAPRAPNTV